MWLVYVFIILKCSFYEAFVLKISKHNYIPDSCNHSFFFLNTTYSSRIIFRIRFVSENYNKKRQITHALLSKCIIVHRPYALHLWWKLFGKITFTIWISSLLCRYYWALCCYLVCLYKKIINATIFRNKNIYLLNKVNPFIYQQDIYY